jgi:hypothetical protein
MSVMTAGERKRRAGAARGRRLVTGMPGQPNVMAGPWPGAGERHRAAQRAPGRAGRPGAAVVARPRSPVERVTPAGRTEAALSPAAGASVHPSPAARPPVHPSPVARASVHPSPAARPPVNRRPAGGPALNQPWQAGTRRARTRVRLTRRGRVVVVALLTASMVLVAALAWLAGTARADAAGSGVPSSALYHSLRAVVVQPGQSLWSIAAQYEPGSDPRNVIQQIIDLNALGSTSIQPGQRLWLPRG